MQVADRAVGGDVIPVTGGQVRREAVQQAIDGGAKVYGLEVDGQYALMSSLRLDFGVALNRARYDRDALNTSLSSACGAQTVCSINIGGNALPRQSDLTWNLGAQHFGQLFSTVEYFVRLDAIYQSEQFASDANIATIEERRLFNARAGVSQERQGWSLDIWAKNLLDREYVSNAIVVNASANVRQNYGPVLGQRRTTGITFTYRFQ